MTNVEKAQEIAESSFSKRTKDLPVNQLRQLIIKQSCLEMAEWKEHQMIDKAVEWLEKNIAEATGIDAYAITESFKKAMEE